MKLCWETFHRGASLKSIAALFAILRRDKRKGGKQIGRAFLRSALLSPRVLGFGKRGLWEKGSFQKSPFSRDSREFSDSRFSREPPDCGKERRFRPFSSDSREFRDFRVSRDFSSEKPPFRNDPFFRSRSSEPFLGQNVGRRQGLSLWSGCHPWRPEDSRESQSDSKVNPWGRPQSDSKVTQNCQRALWITNLVAPYCAIPRDYLSDTPLLRAMGFLVSQHGQLGAIPPSPFSERFPLGEHAKWRCDTPPSKGVSQRYLRDTLWKQGKWVRYPPLRYYLERVLRDRGVSRTGPLR